MHAETLSAVGGLESSSMVAVRLTEQRIADPNPSLQHRAHHFSLSTLLPQIVVTSSSWLQKRVQYHFKLQCLHALAASLQRSEPQAGSDFWS